MANNWTKTDWLVIAYVGPQLTSKGDRLVHLYPDIPGGARFHCCTVYEDKFDQLPFGLGEQLMSDDIIAGSAPEMAAAKTQGILKSCPAFMIETWVKEDGAKTKKLAGVIGPASAGSARAAAGRVSAGVAHEEAVEGFTFNELDEDEVLNQVRVIGRETYIKIRTAYDVYEELEEYMDWHSVDEEEPVNAVLFNAIWRDINDQYRVVRPALLAPAEIIGETQYMDGNQIFIGERANFLEDVARLHASIDDADDVKDICKILDIKGSSNETATRVVQAQQIWMYATLVHIFGMDEDNAAAIAMANYPLDEVPF